jgi:uncharacterized protein YukE
MSALSPEDVARAHMAAATELASEAEQIDRLAKDIEALIRSATAAWRGPDADRFAKQWQGRLLTLVGTKAKLLAHANELYLRATRQQSW